MLGTLTAVDMWVIGGGLGIILAVLAWDIRNLHAVSQQVEKTREEIRDEYMTKSDCNKAMEAILDRIESEDGKSSKTLDRLEEKIDKNEMASAKTRHDMRDAQNQQGYLLAEVKATLNVVSKQGDKLSDKIDTIQATATAAAAAAATAAAVNALRNP